MICLWFTGISGAGKTTLALATAERIRERGIPTVVIDGDDLRGVARGGNSPSYPGLSSDLGFSKVDRREQMRRVGALARLLLDQGLAVMVSIAAPYEAYRQRAAEVIGRSRFRLIHVATPLNVCIMRDTRGLYARAAREKGYDPNAGYEPPVEFAYQIDASFNAAEVWSRKLAQEVTLGLAEGAGI